MPHPSPSLGALLRNAREAGNWPLRSLSLRLDCSIALLRALERDEANDAPLSDTWLRQLARLLEIDAASIIHTRRAYRDVKRQQELALMRQREIARYGVHAGQSE